MHRSLNSFECPRCPCTLTTMSEENIVRASPLSFACPTPCMSMSVPVELLHCMAHTQRTRLAAQGFYLCCSFCRWDSMSLEVEHLGIEPFVDEKPDQLICAPVRLIPLIVSAAASGLSQPQD